MTTLRNVFISMLTLFCLLYPNQGYAITMVKGMTGEYIKVLDITVAENRQGDINIVRIGRYGPFKRYSWFRVGDVIEAVDGKKVSIFDLQGIDQSQTPFIRYRRGRQTAERQISLERTLYGYPPFVNRHQPVPR
ncbi:MAG: hypothetical protein ACE5G9_05225 [Nitrospinales bacterium]